MDEVTSRASMARSIVCPCWLQGAKRARWSQDRRTAWRLRDGVEREAISLAQAAEIAKALGVEVPAARQPLDHGAARVSKGELDGLSLTKRQRAELQQQQQRRRVQRITSSQSVDCNVGSEEEDCVSFEDVWRVLTSAGAHSGASSNKSEI